MRRRTTLAVAALLGATVVLTACAGAGQSASPPSASYNPARNGPETPAAGLRLHWTLLLQERQLLAYRVTGALVENHPDQAAAYQDQLSRNAADLGDLIGATYGASARARFGPLWSASNRGLVGIAQALAAHERLAAERLLAAQGGATTPALTDLLAGLTGVARTPLATALARQVDDSASIATAQAAGNESAAQQTLQGATGRLASLGAAIARATHRAHPELAPGDPDSRAATLAVELAGLLQRHAYQADAAGSALQGGTEKITASARALNTTAADLARVLDAIFGSDARRRFTAAWTARDRGLLDYAAAAARADPGGEQLALQQLTQLDTPRLVDILEALVGTPGEALTPPLLDQVTASAAAFDAQAAGRAGDAARADHQAAALTTSFAVRLAVAITAQSPASFA